MQGIQIWIYSQSFIPLGKFPSSLSEDSNIVLFLHEQRIQPNWESKSQPLVLEVSA